MTRVEQHAAQIATITNSENKTEQEVPPADSPLKDDEQQLMEVFNGLISENMDDLGDIILNPDLLEEESILDNVDELIDDVVPVEPNAGGETSNTQNIANVETDQANLDQSIDVKSLLKTETSSDELSVNSILFYS